MAYIAALVLVFVVAASVGLGFARENWFLLFGLLIVVISAATSIALAGIGWVKAARAEKVDFESYLPREEEAGSHSFDFTGDIMGVDISNPIKHLQRQVEEIKKVVSINKKTINSALRFNEARIDSCLAQIRYHEQVTLPKTLGQGSGSIILAGVLTIIGSAYLAFPDPLYERFSSVASTLKELALSL